VQDGKKIVRRVHSKSADLWCWVERANRIYRSGNIQGHEAGDTGPGMDFLKRIRKEWVYYFVC
jgi:hypothetical protein